MKRSDSRFELTGHCAAGQVRCGDRQVAGGGAHDVSALCIGCSCARQLHLRGVL